MLLDYCCLISTHLCRCVHVHMDFAHLCVHKASQVPSFFSSPHTCTDDIGDITYAPGERKSQPAVSLQRCMTPEVQRSQKELLRTGDKTPKDVTSLWER